MRRSATAETPLRPLQNLFEGGDVLSGMIGGAMPAASYCACAETPANASPSRALLWRRIDADSYEPARSREDRAGILLYEMEDFL
jgi:hypothetical protein